MKRAKNIVSIDIILKYHQRRSPSMLQRSRGRDEHNTHRSLLTFLSPFLSVVSGYVYMFIIQKGRNKILEKNSINSKNLIKNSSWWIFKQDSPFFFLSLLFFVHEIINFWITFIAFLLLLHVDVNIPSLGSCSWNDSLNIERGKKSKEETRFNLTLIQRTRRFQSEFGAVWLWGNVSFPPSQLWWKFYISGSVRSAKLRGENPNKKLFPWESRKTLHVCSWGRKEENSFHRLGMLMY